MPPRELKLDCSWFHLCGKPSWIFVQLWKTSRIQKVVSGSLVPKVQQIHLIIWACSCGAGSGSIGAWTHCRMLKKAWPWMSSELPDGKTFSSALGAHRWEAFTPFSQGKYLVEINIFLWTRRLHIYLFENAIEFASMPAFLIANPSQMIGELEPGF